MRKLARAFFVLSFLGGISAFVCACYFGIKLKSFSLFLTYALSGVAGVMVSLAFAYILDTLVDLRERLMTEPKTEISSAKNDASMDALRQRYKPEITIAPEALAAARENAAARGDGKIVCPHCGTVQWSDRRCCFSCGASFLEES